MSVYNIYKELNYVYVDNRIIFRPYTFNQGKKEAK